MAEVQKLEEKSRKKTGECYTHVRLIKEAVVDGLFCSSLQNLKGIKGSYL